MEIGLHLAAFLIRIENDMQISPSQICLYVILLNQWNREGQVNPFQVYRDNVMQMTKISARSTFNKSMKALHRLGYIRYFPSYNPDVPSLVCINLL